jgi:arabinofuranosyltransferase
MDVSYGTANDDMSGISDERYFYETRTGLLGMDRNIRMPNISWVEEGRGLRREKTQLYVRGVVGLVGYFAGPEVYILDPYAIGDPLLARLKVRKDDWRIGHFRRPIPDGYQETLETGHNVIRDPGLAEYYDDLMLITRGPIWSRERWILIWQINTGQLDYLLTTFNR